MLRRSECWKPCGDAQRLVTLGLRQVPVTGHERQQCPLVIAMGALRRLAILVQEIDNLLPDRGQLIGIGLPDVHDSHRGQGARPERRPGLGGVQGKS